MNKLLCQCLRYSRQFSNWRAFIRSAKGANISYLIRLRSFKLACLKTHSDKLCLTHAAAADGYIATSEIENFLFFARTLCHIWDRIFFYFFARTLCHTRTNESNARWVNDPLTFQRTETLLWTSTSSPSWCLFTWCRWIAYPLASRVTSPTCWPSGHPSCGREFTRSWSEPRWPHQRPLL